MQRSVFTQQFIVKYIYCLAIGNAKGIAQRHQSQNLYHKSMHIVHKLTPNLALATTLFNYRSSLYLIPMHTISSITASNRRPEASNPVLPSGVQETTDFLLRNVGNFSVITLPYLSLIFQEEVSEGA